MGTSWSTSTLNPSRWRLRRPELPSARLDPARLVRSTMLLPEQVPACYKGGVVVSRPSIHFCIVFYTSSTTRAPLLFFFFLACSQIFAPLEHVFLCCILFQSALAYSNLLLAFPCFSQVKLTFPISRLFHSTTCYSSNCVAYATPCELTSAELRIRRFPSRRTCMPCVVTLLLSLGRAPRSLARGIRADQHK
jgi:hypothetical protein